MKMKIYLLQQQLVTLQACGSTRKLAWDISGRGKLLIITNNKNNKQQKITMTLHIMYNKTS